MKQYTDLVRDIIDNGEYRKDRTGTGTIAVFDRQLKFDMQDGFPAVSEKFTWMKGVWVELLWMLSGSTNAEYMLDNDVHIWDDWMDERGELGPVYGVQWRKWASVGENGDIRITDQLADVIERIKSNPTDRRLLVSAWNPGELDGMALPPCHYAFQFYVRRGKYLDLKYHQRSADVFLGLPFDIASYATLLHMVAHVTNLEPGRLSVDLGDTHLYLNHMDQVEELLKRNPMPLPTLDINVHGRDIKSIDDFKLDDLKLNDYLHRGAIKADVSV